MENKTIMVSLSGMNRKIRKYNSQGWRVVSTSSAGPAGTYTVFMEREVLEFGPPQPSPREARAVDAQRRLNQDRDVTPHASAHTSGKPSGLDAALQPLKEWQAKRDARRATKRQPPTPW